MHAVHKLCFPQASNGLVGRSQICVQTESRTRRSFKYRDLVVAREYCSEQEKFTGQA